MQAFGNTTHAHVRQLAL